MDGHPRYVIPRGKTYVYEFEVKNPACTFWCHPHPHRRIGLPVIQDRVFDQSNQLIYLPNVMMDQMIGFLGEKILANG